MPHNHFFTPISKFPICGYMNFCFIFSYEIQKMLTGDTLISVHRNLEPSFFMLVQKNDYAGAINFFC